MEGCDVNTGNDFCRTCGCNFPPDPSELACVEWERCRRAQQPKAAGQDAGRQSRHTDDNGTGPAPAAPTPLHDYECEGSTTLCCCHVRATVRDLERRLAEALNENDAMAKDYLELGRKLEDAERQLAKNYDRVVAALRESAETAALVLQYCPDVGWRVDAIGAVTKARALLRELEES